jgi:hypothetical protein
MFHAVFAVFADHLAGRGTGNALALLLQLGL